MPKHPRLSLLFSRGCAPATLLLYCFPLLLFSPAFSQFAGTAPVTFPLQPCHLTLFSAPPCSRREKIGQGALAGFTNGCIGLMTFQVD